jgi:hypothetical protein
MTVQIHQEQQPAGQNQGNNEIHRAGTRYNIATKKEQVVVEEVCNTNGTEQKILLFYFTARWTQHTRTGR